MLDNIITIDGPAGSGKSTVAKILARELNLKYIDTGAMYRAITLLALQNNIDCKDEESILKLARNINLQLDSNSVDESKYTTVKIDGKDVTDEIRSREVGSAVSIVSKLSGVRKYLVSLQKKFIQGGNAVLEGRDTGSVVCPDAALKIYLTASLDERIKRRDLQISGKGQFLERNIIKKEIISRDRIDSSREDSPLVIPENGIIIDTSKLSIKGVVEKIKKLYFKKVNVKNET
ncbi:MAG: (d)CMP kinase [Actinobacteria bacterium]|nr:(d)CMP kinase [Actinomycetota bacterium]MBL7123279.1 (d)CMP kinase [Actinomycetota bacterium]